MLRDSWQEFASLMDPAIPSLDIPNQWVSLGLSRGWGCSFSMHHGAGPTWLVYLIETHEGWENPPPKTSKICVCIHFQVSHNKGVWLRFYISIYTHTHAFVLSYKNGTSIATKVGIKGELFAVGQTSWDVHNIWGRLKEPAWQLLVHWQSRFSGLHLPCTVGRLVLIVRCFGISPGIGPDNFDVPIGERMDPARWVALKSCCWNPTLRHFWVTDRHLGTSDSIFDWSTAVWTIIISLVPFSTVPS